MFTNSNKCRSFPGRLHASSEHDTTWRKCVSAAIAHLGHRQTEGLKVPSSTLGLGMIPTYFHCNYLRCLSIMNCGCMGAGQQAATPDNHKHKRYTMPQHYPR